jgi:hypothetical protein
MITPLMFVHEKTIVQKTNQGLAPPVDGKCFRVLVSFSFVGELGFTQPSAQYVEKELFDKLEPGVTYTVKINV